MRLREQLHQDTQETGGQGSQPLAWHPCTRPWETPGPGGGLSSDQEEGREAGRGGPCRVYGHDALSLAVCEHHLENYCSFSKLRQQWVVICSKSLPRPSPFTRLAIIRLLAVSTDTVLFIHLFCVFSDSTGSEISWHFSHLAQCHWVYPRRHKWRHFILSCG